MLDLPISPLLAMPDDQWFALCAVAIVAIVAGAFRGVLIARARAVAPGDHRVHGGGLDHARPGRAAHGRAEPEGLQGMIRSERP